jgi:hypothetical protein
MSKSGLFRSKSPRCLMDDSRYHAPLARQNFLAYLLARPEVGPPLFDDAETESDDFTTRTNDGIIPAQPGEKLFHSRADSYRLDKDPASEL